MLLGLGITIINNSSPISSGRLIDNSIFPLFLQTLPLSFVKKHLKDDSRRLTLEISDGRRWLVRCRVYKDVSTHNQYSHSCLVVNHCAGSKSFVRIHADMPIDLETQQEAGMIALYCKTHFSEKKGWVSHEAENNYERMVELRNQPTPEDSNPLTEEEIFYEVLGIRPGYKRGFGHVEAPPSRKCMARYEHPDVDKLRARAKEAESQLEKLRGWKDIVV
ncbi:hypothetical protein IFM89_001381 [Coptis chinensis]|uniref:Uncharacterized protein n=1 Tax=Coptis chinensis TaxID=261450 RepID=A0A835HQP2_9MAGN|nr:hypothetical protein IFM89_001381 [Coptis chinensis]